MPHWTHDKLFSQVSDSKNWHDRSKNNFEKKVLETAAEYGQTPKKVVSQIKDDSTDILNKD